MPYEWGSSEWLRHAEQQSDNLISLLDQAYQEVVKGGEQVEDLEVLLEGILRFTEEFYPLKVSAVNDVDAATLREVHNAMRHICALRAASTGTSPPTLHTLSFLINWLTHAKARIRHSVHQRQTSMGP